MRSRRAAPRTQLQGLVDDLPLQWARRVPHPGAQLHGTALSSGPTGGMGATSQRVAAALRTQSTGTRTPRPPQSTAQRGSPVPTALAVPRSSGRVAGTRSQRQRGQGRLKQGSPHPTAVSGCLLAGVEQSGGGWGGGVPCPGRAVRRELERGVLRVHLGVRGVQGGVVEQRVPHFHFSGLQSEMEGKSGRSGPAAEHVTPPCTAPGPEPSGGTEARPGGPEPRRQQWGSSPRLRQLPLNGPVKT